MGNPISMKREDYKIFYPVTTRWMDNDLYGHINNVTYYSYFDTAANTFLIRHCGLDIHHGNIVGLVVNSACEFLAPIAFPDAIEVGVRIDHLGNSSVRYGIGIFKGKKTHACAIGHLVHVFVNRSSKKPVAIPDAMRRKMKKIEVESASGQLNPGNTS